ncbi:glycosyltransferase 87 family protein [Kribbella sp. HUAS MG21]|uniref:Glycosyltransferase 87 family protein n=1 Tax=Kribbella sp. HUAS MG21 TaxID=3160966 RepID=A0AAU7TL91_9ACTN
MTIDGVSERVRRRTPTAILVLAATMLPVACLLVWHPWNADMGDLRVYHAAARALTDGRDIYDIPGLGLGFTYPPFAALVFAPFAVGAGFARVLITLASAAALLVIGWTTARALRWGSVAALGIAFAALVFEPVWSSFGLGQINLVLLALLMLDLVGPMPRRFRGVLIGVATGIKLTPGIFIVFLLITRRFREAAVAAGTTVATMLLAYAVMPKATTDFWTKYVFDPSRPGPAHYISNQSLRGAIARVTGNSATTVPLWLLAASIVGVAGLLVARRLHDRGLPFEAVVVTALTGLLVSPISWTGHWVWAVPATALVWARCSVLLSWRTAGAAAMTFVFVTGLPWWLPFAHDQEFGYNAVQTVVANAYLLCAVLIIAQAVNSDARIRYTWRLRS